MLRTGMEVWNVIDPNNRTNGVHRTRLEGKALDTGPSETFDDLSALRRNNAKSSNGRPSRHISSIKADWQWFV